VYAFLLHLQVKHSLQIFYHRIQHWPGLKTSTRRKKFLFIIPKNIAGELNFIKKLIEKGSFKPVIDRKYPLAKIADAYTYVASGQKIGNVVITMDDDISN